MPRSPRIVPPDGILHVLNRANGRRTLFSDPGDYRSFAVLLAKGLIREDVPLYAYCLMPNHWHLVLQATDGAHLARLMHWVTTKHAVAWHAYRGTAGEGHLYQGRYKTFPVQADEHFLAVCRYVERNPVRAGLVPAASQWPWSSHCAHVDREAIRAPVRPSAWPVRRPPEWREWVDLPQSDAELAAVRASIRRGAPFGSRAWQQSVASQTGRRWSARARGRPRKLRAEPASFSHK